MYMTVGLGRSLSQTVVAAARGPKPTTPKPWFEDTAPAPVPADSPGRAAAAYADAGLAAAARPPPKTSESTRSVSFWDTVRSGVGTSLGRLDERQQNAQKL